MALAAAACSGRRHSHREPDWTCRTRRDDEVNGRPLATFVRQPVLADTCRKPRYCSTGLTYRCEAAGDGAVPPLASGTTFGTDTVGPGEAELHVGLVAP